MNDHPAPALAPPPPITNDGGHRMRLNNWLQAHGWLHRHEFIETKTGPDHEPTWCAVYKFDGEECGRSEAKKLAHAKEEAARIALQNIADRMGVPAP